MPALNISAVTAGTDQLTITAHGLTTGDGPAAMFEASAGAVLPGGLAPVTSYWIIRDDDDKIRLAISSTDAMAGTAIDITDAGSGTLQLLIGVPYRRPRTYLPSSMGVAGAQLKSADLNSNFDTWIALWNLLTGQTQSVFPDVVLAGGLTVGGDVYGERIRQIFPSQWLSTVTPPSIVANPAQPTLPPVWSLPTNQTVTTRILIEPGETITSIELEVYGDGAVDWIGAVFSYTSSSGAGQESLAGNFPGVTNQAAAWSLETLPAFDVGPQLSGANVSLNIQMTGGTQLYLGMIEVGVKRIA